MLHYVLRNSLLVNECAVPYGCTCTVFSITATVKTDMQFSFYCTNKHVKLYTPENMHHNIFTTPEELLNKVLQIRSHHLMACLQSIPKAQPI